MYMGGYGAAASPATVMLLWSSVIFTDSTTVEGRQAGRRLLAGLN